MSGDRRLRVLVVDDDSSVPLLIRTVLEDDGHEVFEENTGEAVLSRVIETNPDLVLLDVRLPGMSGLQVLKRLRETDFSAPIVMITAHATMDTAVQAMEEGASDFLAKPIRPSALSELCSRIAMRVDARPAFSLSPQPDGEAESFAFIGQSPEIIDVYKRIGQVARADTTVLIEGESGTGKELVARLIHERSRRSGRFIGVNCAAIPASLLESQMFGHEKGAFTGAVERRVGEFQQAHEGTLLLDEIGDFPMELQGKLLRAIEEREIRPIGAETGVPVDVRLIASSRFNLETKVEAREFREDLFYRLAVARIRIPPLRDRAGDVKLLIDYFARKFASKLDRDLDGIAAGVYERLREHPWPGNIRELRNVIERALLFSRGRILTGDDLPALNEPAPSLAASLQPFINRSATLEELEREYIQMTLRATNGNQSETARRLGIHRNTLRRRIRNYGLGGESGGESSGNG